MTSINLLKMLEDSLDSEIADKEIQALQLTEQLVKLEREISRLRSVKRLQFVENAENKLKESIPERQSGESNFIDR